MKHVAHARAVAVIVVMLVATACQPGRSPDLRSSQGSAPSPVPSRTMVETEKPAPPSPTVFYEVTKTAEGAHGGPPAIELAGPIAIEYTFEGTCSVTIGVIPELGAVPYAQLTLEVAGPRQSGVWRVIVGPGRYYVGPDEAVGCTYHVVVRADS